MKVLKVINNNVISCLDEHGQEAVVMGRGLGFQAKPGMDLDPGAAEKIFHMDTPEEASRLTDLFSRLPPELLELCTQIVDYANQILGRRLNKSIYLTLTDHIYFAIERIRQGMVLQNALYTEVRVFYPEEYAIGRYALEQIDRKLGVTLPEDEAASVALHLVNAEYDRSMNVTMRAAQVLQPIVKILEEFPGLQLDTGSLHYDELIVHLKFMAMEAFTQEGKNWNGLALADPLRERIPVAWNCAQLVCQYLAEQSGNAVPADEQAYLTICIHRACVF